MMAYTSTPNSLPLTNHPYLSETPGKTSVFLSSSGGQTHVEVNFNMFHKIRGGQKSEFKKSIFMLCSSSTSILPNSFQHICIYLF